MRSLLLVGALALLGAGCTRPAPRPAPPPAVPLVVGPCPPSPSREPPDAGTGWLSKDAIRSVVHAHLGEVHACYAHAKERWRLLAGKIAIQFVISNPGPVCAAQVDTSTIPDVELGNCLVRAVASWRFPPVNGEGVVKVTYPFEFVERVPRASVSKPVEEPEVIDRCAAPPVGVADGGIGWIEKEDIRQVVRANIGEVRRCYEEALTRNASVAGKVPVRFVIAREGDVCAAKAAEATVLDVAMTNCVVRAVSRLRFPTLQGDGLVVVTYPFIFKQPDSAPDAGTNRDGGVSP